MGSVESLAFSRSKHVLNYNHYKKLLPHCYLAILVDQNPKQAPNIGASSIFCVGYQNMLGKHIIFWPLLIEN